MEPYSHNDYYYKVAVSNSFNNQPINVGDITGGVTSIGHNGSISSSRRSHSPPYSPPSGYGSVHGGHTPQPQFLPPQRQYQGLPPAQQQPSHRHSVSMPLPVLPGPHWNLIQPGLSPSHQRHQPSSAQPYPSSRPQPWQSASDDCYRRDQSYQDYDRLHEEPAAHTQNSPRGSPPPLWESRPTRRSSSPQRNLNLDGGDRFSRLHDLPSERSVNGAITTLRRQTTTTSIQGEQRKDAQAQGAMHPSSHRCPPGARGPNRANTGLAANYGRTEFSGPSNVPFPRPFMGQSGRASTLNALNEGTGTRVQDRNPFRNEAIMAAYFPPARSPRADERAQALDDDNLDDNIDRPSSYHVTRSLIQKEEDRLLDSPNHQVHSTKQLGYHRDINDEGEEPRLQVIRQQAQSSPLHVTEDRRSSLPMQISSTQQLEYPRQASDEGLYHSPLALIRVPRHIQDQGERRDKEHTFSRNAERSRTYPRPILEHTRPSRSLDLRSRPLILGDLNEHPAEYEGAGNELAIQFKKLDLAHYGQHPSEVEDSTEYRSSDENGLGIIKRKRNHSADVADDRHLNRNSGTDHDFIGGVCFVCEEEVVDGFITPCGVKFCQECADAAMKMAKKRRINGRSICENAENTDPNSLRRFRSTRGGQPQPRRQITHNTHSEG